VLSSRCEEGARKNVVRYGFTGLALASTLAIVDNVGPLQSQSALKHDLDSTRSRKCNDRDGTTARKASGRRK